MVVVRAVDKMELPIFNEGREASLVCSAERNQGKGNVGRIGDVVEGERSERISIGNLDTEGALPNGLKGLIVCSRDGLWCDELKVSEGLDIRGHVAHRTAIIDLNVFGPICFRSDIRGRQ